MTNLYLDVETTGLNPWIDKICGIGYAIDDDNPVYLPIRHTYGENLDIEYVRKLIQDIIDKSKVWINHNIKFDMHFLEQDLGIKFPNVEIFDTMSIIKLIDVNLPHYSLEFLANKLCNLPMDEKKEIKVYTKAGHEVVPIDIETKYSRMDIISTRQLYKWILDHIPSDMSLVLENEKLITRILYEIEKTGMRIDLEAVKKETYKSLVKQIELQTMLKTKTGYEFNSKSHNDLEELLLTHMQLPIIAYTTEDKTSASFGKDTLSLYIARDDISDSHKEILRMIRDLNIEEHFYNTFLLPYKELQVNGVLHPSYNQIIRTGRMSCSKPNAQQLNNRAKKLILPSKEENIIVSADASQIEFRVIAHYIKDSSIINAYNKDPNTDFHEWVSKMCSITRKNAKTINFSMAYGAGKTKVLEQLSKNPEILEATGGNITRCTARTEEIYHKYHETIPGIKDTARRACAVATNRGYVFNLYGRRRAIERRYAYSAFNTISQGTAADIYKDGIIQLWKKKLPISIFALVHDDVCFCCNNDPALLHEVKEALEDIHPPREFLVPIIYNLKASSTNWGELKNVDTH